MTDTDPQPQTWTDGDTATPMSRNPQPPGQSQVYAVKVGRCTQPSVQTQREAVRGTQGSWDEHNGLNPQRTNPSLTDANLESQAAYLECPFPLGELLLILQDPAQVFPLLWSFP